MKSVIIVGSGMGGLSAAALLAKAGYKVTVLEKNGVLGGRTGAFEVRKKKNKWVETDGTGSGSGFRFDMGPSWYLMPDVFEHFFELLGEKVEDHLDLVRLSPGYRIFFKERGQMVDIYSDLERDLPTIEALEPGAGKRLQRYLAQAQYQYNIVKDRFMYRNHDSARDLMKLRTVMAGKRLGASGSLDKYVGRYFKTDTMRKLMQYPLVFLGASPYNTPAIYNILSHADFGMGVYHPKGGMHEVVKALQRIGGQLGVEYQFNTPVRKIFVEQGRARGVELENGDVLKADVIISNAGLHHTEQELLESGHRSKSEKYWQKRTMPPSALVIYLGVKGKLPTLAHHNLLFSRDWHRNHTEIFDHPMWPNDPSLYICNPNKTDPAAAPKGHENLSIVVPVAANLDYKDKQLEAYADKVLANVEASMNLPELREKTVYKRLFSVHDFEQHYNSHQGSALGLPYSFGPSAIPRPNNGSQKVRNLYYVGADTNLGVGLPATLISAELVYKRLTGDRSTGPLQPDQLLHE